MLLLDLREEKHVWLWVLNSPGINSRDCLADELMERANIIALEVLPNKSALPEEAVRGSNWQIDSKPIDSTARFWQNEQSSRKYATCTRSARKLLSTSTVGSIKTIPPETDILEAKILVTELVWHTTTYPPRYFIDLSVYSFYL